jgi:hypothetical protein
VVLRQKLPSSSSSSSLQAGSREKDKSTKRKSNLNRALTDEQVLATGQIESQGSFNSLSSYLFFIFIFISSRPSTQKLDTSRFILFLFCFGQSIFPAP